AEPSAFGTAPDLMSRYSLGLDYMGQPVYEVAARIDSVGPPVKFAGDWNPKALPTKLVNGIPNGLPFNLLANNPYEIDLSGLQRRDNLSASFSDSDTAFF